MSWKDDDFIRGNRGQSYGGPSMEEIAAKVHRMRSCISRVLDDRINDIFLKKQGPWKS